MPYDQEDLIHTSQKSTILSSNDSLDKDIDINSKDWIDMNEKSRSVFDFGQRTDSYNENNEKDVEQKTTTWDEIRRRSK